MSPYTNEGQFMPGVDLEGLQKIEASLPWLESNHNSSTFQPVKF
jgi:hypothetical protein